MQIGADVPDNGSQETRYKYHLIVWYKILVLQFMFHLSDDAQGSTVPNLLGMLEWREKYALTASIFIYRLIVMKKIAILEAD